MGTCVTCGTELADELICPKCHTVQDMEKAAKIIETKKMKHNGKAVASIVLAALSLVFEFALITVTVIISFAGDREGQRMITSGNFLLSPYLLLIALVGAILGVMSIYGQKSVKGLIGVCFSIISLCIIAILLTYSLYVQIT
jgi:hypothetical protein